MSLTQAKILLEKINALQKSMGLGDGAVIPIERDLMLSYIRQLYDVYLDVDDKPIARPVPRPVTRKMPPPPPPKPEPIPEPELPKAAPPPPQPVVAPPPPPPVVQAPPPPVEPKPVEMARPTFTAPTNNNVVLNSRVESLFSVREATELSEKLGERSIKDLTRALAINDRLLYANTLFGKNMDEMSQSLDRLNRLSGMQEAKPILGEYASRFDWPDEEKADMARDFIKLVRRRYM